MKIVPALLSPDEYYDIDDANALFDKGELNSPIKTFRFSQPGTYVVGQLLTTSPPLNPSVFRRTFVVRPTPAPKFTATQCGPDQVQVTIQDTNYDSLYLFVNNASRQVVTASPTPIILTSPTTTYTLRLSGEYSAGNCGRDSILTITPPPPAGQVKITLLQVRPGGIIKFAVNGLQAGYKYQLQDQNGNSKAVFNFKNSPTDSVVLGGFDTSVPNCFKVVTLDNCDRPQGLPSPVICSTTIQALAQNNQNLITWPAYTGETPSGSAFTYKLFRRENNTPNRTEIASVASQTLSFTDDQVKCGINYCYDLEITDTNGRFSVSDKVCVTAISTDIPAAANLLTSFGTDNVLIGSVTVPANSELKNLQVLKNSNGLAFAPLTQTTTPDFKDPDRSFKQIKPCYQVTFTDNCGNTSLQSNQSCPVILRATEDKLNRTATLEWSEYGGFDPAAAEYSLELLDANFTVRSAEPVTNVFSRVEKLSDTDQILRYRIKVTANGQVSYSNLETIIQEVKIFVPNAFSPNGDGLNDVFEVKGRFQNNFSLLILNRWGQVIFESRDPKKGWDGQVNGAPAPVGVYAYRLQAIDERGQRYEKTGTLTLLK